MTLFQDTVKKEHIIQICKILNPSLTDDQLENVSYYTKYTWLYVECKVKGYGLISFGIDNHFTSYKLMGMISDDQIKKSIKNKTIQFNVWRFFDDIHYEQDQLRRDKIPKEVYAVLNDNYSIPTFAEFKKYYYYKD